MWKGAKGIRRILSKTQLSVRYRDIKKKGRGKTIQDYGVGMQKGQYEFSGRKADGIMHKKKSSKGRSKTRVVEQRTKAARKGAFKRSGKGV